MTLIINFKDIVLERLAEIKRPEGLLFKANTDLNPSTIKDHQKLMSDLQDIVDLMSREKYESESVLNLLYDKRNSMIPVLNKSLIFMTNSKLVIDDYNNFLLQAQKAEISSMRRTYWLRFMTVFMTGMSLISLGVIALAFNLPIPMLKFATFN